MKVAMCVIGRLENRYAIEYVEYYKKLGVDKIIIIDNNFGDEEHFEEVLQPYIDDGLVIIENHRDEQDCQIRLYAEIYHKYNKEYNWIYYSDFDEFLYIVNGTDIKEFLSQDVFENYDVIQVNWRCYGDNGLVEYDDRPVQERFKEPFPDDIKYTYYFPYNNHIKSIVRCGINEFNWKFNTHSPSMENLEYCDASGVRTTLKPFKPYDFSKCYIKHYFTKTIDEWMNHKYYRQYADRPHVKLDKKTLIDNFFLLNEITDDKAKYVLDKFGINIKK
jgi:hypothetical protein